MYVGRGLDPVNVIPCESETGGDEGSVQEGRFGGELTYTVFEGPRPKGQIISLFITRINEHFLDILKFSFSITLLFSHFDGTERDSLISWGDPISSTGD